MIKRSFSFVGNLNSHGFHTFAGMPVLKVSAKVRDLAMHHWTYGIQMHKTIGHPNFSIMYTTASVFTFAYSWKSKTMKPTMLDARNKCICVVIKETGFPKGVTFLRWDTKKELARFYVTQTFTILFWERSIPFLWSELAYALYKSAALDVMAGWWCLNPWSSRDVSIFATNVCVLQCFLKSVRVVS